MIRHAAPFAATLALIVLAACETVPGARGYSGADLYADNCSGCHGADAKGGLEVGGQHPPDLTALAARHGGRYPAEYVMSTIDGLERERTHGIMPIFGTLLSGPVETWIDAQGNPVPTPATLIALNEYLEDRQGD